MSNNSDQRAICVGARIANSEVAALRALAERREVRPRSSFVTLCGRSFAMPHGEGPLCMIGTSLKPDDVARLDAYANEHNLTRSAALRELLRRGLARIARKESNDGSRST